MPTPSPLRLQITTDPSMIQRIAFATWYPTYQNILAPEQIEYMLHTVYSLAALREQMQDGQTFLLATWEETPAAFASFSCLEAATGHFKLNKIYIHPNYQGKGIGKLLLQEVIKRVRAQGGRNIELNVHRENPAQHFYLRHGFENSKKVDLPFGPFTLNDYIFSLKLEPEQN